MTDIKRPKFWQIQYTGDSTAEAAIAQIERELSVSRVFAVLLYNRGYTTPTAARAFLDCEETNFHNPFLMVDMDKAVERILRAVENREKIYIYGDYDVDGVTSVSMLYLYLSSLGAPVKYKIPKRDGEGYGICADAVKAIADEGATLIVTVDTGITANAEVELGKELGVDFVITDHHECHGELPAAYAVVNPHRPDCAYPFCSLAGVGVIFKVLCACEMRRAVAAGEREIDGVRRVCAQYSDLVAVGTIADVMPLLDENRLIVKLGLSKLERGECRAGFTSLIAAVNKRGESKKVPKVTSGTVGFGIAPRINAAGRISDAALAARLLLAEDSNEADTLCAQLCEINKQRQSVEGDICAEAYEKIQSNPSFAEDKVIILESDCWHQGIIGIVCSRITERYGVPSILISYQGAHGSPEDDGKGSGRSVDGFNLVEALGACEDLLVKYGGHSLAAGLTVKRGKVDAFRRRINEYARQHMSDDAATVTLMAECEVSPSQMNTELVDQISSLEPFGIGNTTPHFVLRGALICRVSYLGGGKHTKLTLECEGSVLTAMYFGVGEGDFPFDAGEYVDLFFNMDINDYKGVRSLQLIVRDIKTALAETQKRENERKRYEQLRGGERFDESEGIVPDRGDFAAVYTMLRREFRAGTDTMRAEQMLKLLSDSGIGYIKLRFVLRVLNELNICTVEKLGDDLYRFEVKFTAEKTNIEKSSILKKLRMQCNFGR